MTFRVFSEVTLTQIFRIPEYDLIGTERYTVISIIQQKEKEYICEKNENSERQKIRNNYNLIVTTLLLASVKDQI